MEAQDTPSGRRRGGARGRVGVALVMVLCGVLFATTSRLAAGGSIRDESSDVAGVLADRGRTIEELTEDNADKRAEIEELRGQGAGAATAERTAVVEDAVGLSEVSGPGLRVRGREAPLESSLGRAGHGWAPAVGRKACSRPVRAVRVCTISPCCG